MQRSVMLTGVDGSRWNLGGPGRGSTNAWITDLEGLFKPPPHTTVRTSRAYEHGSTHRMTKVEERILDFKVRLEAADRAGLERLIGLWQRAWSFDEDADLAVQTASGQRSIGLRWDRDWKIVSPFSMQSRSVELECVAVACWPYLTSGTDTAVWTAGSGTHSGTVTVSNHADVPLWIEYVGTPGKWTLPDAASGRTVTLPTQSTIWKVRTRGGQITLANTDGGNEWQKLRGVSFMYEIPARAGELELPIKVENSPVPAELRVIQPRYHLTPWG